MAIYNFIKYENTTKNNTTHFNSATSTNTNTTGQKANTIILLWNPIKKLGNQMVGTRIPNVFTTKANELNSLMILF